jgi:hypothetical protein
MSDRIEQLEKIIAQATPEICKECVFPKVYAHTLGCMILKGKLTLSQAPEELRKWAGHCKGLLKDNDPKSDCYGVESCRCFENDPEDFPE